ncbi:MAG: methyltransferase domain-containing protein [Caldilineaceae bacterium]
MSNKDILAGHSSTGHQLSNAEFIDTHYAVCRKSYEAMLHAVGIQLGWHVLDAGCGSGSFLPLMAELVGLSGRIDAFDLAPENIKQVEVMTKEWDVPVTAKVGSLMELPYDNDTFDVVWNANVTQYLTDSETTQVLQELVRVVKPGGYVAIKESDWTTHQLYPFDTFVYWRYREQIAQTHEAWLRVHNLPGWLTRAGLIDITQETFLEEIRAPLPDYVHSFIAAVTRFFSNEVEGLSLPETDKEQWRLFQDPKSPNNPVNHPEFYFREGMTLVLGQKPPTN